jgi:ribosome maturation factor RimP
MKTDTKLRIEEKIGELLQETPELFLVKIKIDAKNNIAVFLDGDNGISIGQCTQINRALYPFIEENEFFVNNDFSLEVSSAGIDEPLLLTRQYTKNVGREVEVLYKDGVKKIGKLMSNTETSITIEITTGKGKKAETSTETIELEQVKSSIVQVKF